MKKHEPSDPVAVYLRKVSNVAPLTKAEQRKLFRELGTGGDWNDAQENVARRLIESQLALVVSIAQKHSASAVPMLELIEQGNLGLMDAVRSFAKKPTGDFSAHAATCIEKAITNALPGKK